MGQTVNLLAYAFGGSNPSLPTAFQAEGRGFEPRLPLSLLKQCFTKGQIPEWPNGADCKSAGLRLRWFESIFAHKNKDAEVAQLIEH